MISNRPNTDEYLQGGLVWRQLHKPEIKWQRVWVELNTLVNPQKIHRGVKAEETMQRARDWEHSSMLDFLDF